MILLLLHWAGAFDGDPVDARLPVHLVQEPEESSRFVNRHLVADVDVWFASFEGSGRLNKVFGVDSPSEAHAPRMSYNRDGHVGRTEPYPELELSVLTERGSYDFYAVRLFFRYGVWSESGTLDAPLTVGGTTVPAGNAFESHFSMWDSGIDVVGGTKIAAVPLYISGWLGFHIYSGRFRMWTPAGELSDGGGCIGLGAGGRMEYRPFSTFFASGELSITAGYGAPMSQAMLSIGGGWEGIRLEAGYRHAWDWLDSVIAFRLSVGGPFVALSYRF